MYIYKHIKEKGRRKIETYLNIAHCLEGGEDKHEAEAQNEHIYKFYIHFEGNK